LTDLLARDFSGLEFDMRPVLWPGHGTRTATDGVYTRPPFKQMPHEQLESVGLYGSSLPPASRQIRGRPKRT